MHPDVSELVWRFRRWHHVVDYSPFKNNPLILKDSARKLPPIQFEIVPAPDAKPRRRRA